MTRAGLVALAAMAAAGACAPDDVPSTAAGPAGAEAGGEPVGGDSTRTPLSPVVLRTETLAAGLAFPWGVAVLPDGSMLVTERDGRLRVIRDGRLVPQPVTGLPELYVENQGGLLDVVLHPRFAENRLVYLSFSQGDTSANHTAVARGVFDGAALSNVEIIFRNAPDKEGGAHFGGRLMFLPDETLLIGLGDGYDWRDQAQDLRSGIGKIARVTDTGAVPADNPFAGRTDARREIYTWGHRNVQGLARDPATGTIYAHEHGPRGGDEINVLRPGANYGWPAITYGVDYSGAPISLRQRADGMEQPMVYWVPSIAPSGMVFYTGGLFAGWQGDLIVSALGHQQIRRVDMEGGRVVGQEILQADRKFRYRQVIQAPDGSLIALTDDGEDGRVLRFTPSAAP